MVNPYGLDKGRGFGQMTEANVAELVFDAAHMSIETLLTNGALPRTGWYSTLSWSDSELFTGYSLIGHRGMNKPIWTHNYQLDIADILNATAARTKLNSDDSNHPGFTTAITAFGRFGTVLVPMQYTIGDEHADAEVISTTVGLDPSLCMAVSRFAADLFITLYTLRAQELAGL